MNVDTAQRAWGRARVDPAWWFREVLGDDPWQKQIEAAEAIRDHREVSIKSSHGTGKSWLAARVALWFLFHWPHSLVLTTAPTDRQVRNIIWREIRTAHAGAKCKLGGELLTQRLELDEDWYAIGFTASDTDPDRFQGFHARAVLVIGDEASGLSEPIMDAVDSITSGGFARRLYIGNPTDPTGRFAKDFKDPAVHKLTISAFDTPNFLGLGITLEDIKNGRWVDKTAGQVLPRPYLVTPEWVARRFARWGVDSPMFQSRVLAQFPNQGTDVFIFMAWIEAAQNRELKPTGDVQLGVDVGGSIGGAKTSVYSRRGGVIRREGSWRTPDTVETAGKVLEIIERTGASITRIDGIGVGSGVYNILWRHGVRVESVNVGVPADDNEMFTRLRSELHWNLRDMFEKGEADIDPADEELAAQLASIKAKYTPDGRVRVETKEEMRARNMESPDDLDAVVLACAGRKYEAGSGSAYELNLAREGAEGLGERLEELSGVLTFSKSWED